jgi:hypothetical protein
MLGAGSEILVFAWVVLFPNKSVPPVSMPLPQFAGLYDCWPGNCDFGKPQAYCVLFDTHPRTGTVPSAAEPAASVD